MRVCGRHFQGIMAGRPTELGCHIFTVNGFKHGVNICIAHICLWNMDKGKQRSAIQIFTLSVNGVIECCFRIKKFLTLQHASLLACCYIFFFCFSIVDAALFFFTLELPTDFQAKWAILQTSATIITHNHM
ncbi:hypothetical protein ACJX0J_023673 [Zea mays]